MMAATGGFLTNRLLFFELNLLPTAYYEDTKSCIR